MWHSKHIERLQMTQQSTYAMQDVRRENVRRYVNENGGPTTVAKRLGHSNGSYLVQMVGPNPTRPVTEKSARAFEAQLGLPAGKFDEPVVQTAVTLPRPTPRATSPAAMSTDEIVNMIGAVMAACKDESVDLPSAKFADVLALAIKNTAEHGGEVDNSYVQTLVRLVK